MTSRLRFFLDESVPHSVGRVLEDAGHTVIYLSEAISAGSTDDVVAAAALANDAVLVAIDKDMRTSASRHRISSRQFKEISLLQLRCKETQAANRVEQALELIKFEWRWSEEKAARRLFIEIGNSRITINR